MNGYPFFLWLLAGIIPWFYISEMLTQGSTTLKRYNYLVTKIKFPVSTISTFVSLSKLYVHLALVAVVVVIFVAFGYPIDIYYLQLPLYMALLFVFFTLWSMFSVALSAISKDFANASRLSSPRSSGCRESCGTSTRSRTGDQEDLCSTR